MADGKSLEHTGVMPNELALPSADAIAKSLDPVLAHAAESLGVKVSRKARSKRFLMSGLQSSLPSSNCFSSFLRPSSLGPTATQRPDDSEILSVIQILRQVSGYPATNICSFIDLVIADLKISSPMIGKRC